MKLLALLDEIPLALMRAQIDQQWQVTVLNRLADLGDVCRTSRRFDVLVIGPKNFGTTREAIRRSSSFLRKSGAPAVVVLAPDELKAMSFVIELVAARLAFELALWSNNGRMEGLQDSIRRAVASGLSNRIASELLEKSRGLSPTWVDIISDLFRCPSDFAHRDAVLSRSGHTVAAMNNNLRAAGLRSFRQLRRASRLSRCHFLIRTCGLNLQVAARRAGYGSIDALDRDVKKLVPSATPTSLLSRMSEDELLSRVIAYCSIARHDTSVGVDVTVRAPR